MNFIKTIYTPTRLLLVWQPPEGKPRSRLVVGELTFAGGSCVFNYLDGTDDFKKALDEGFVCYPAFRKLTHEYREGVLETFLSRIPPRRRGDFGKYLEQWRLAPDINISDFALLGHTGAKLPNDGFSLINPFDGMEAPFEFYVEVAGFRHQENICLADISVDMSVNFIQEPENTFDGNAVRVEVAGKKIGYVNKVQNSAFNLWLENYSITACIERINGTEARPLIYIYGQVSSENKQQIAA